MAKYYGPETYELEDGRKVEFDVWSIGIYPENTEPMSMGGHLDAPSGPGVYVIFADTRTPLYVGELAELHHWSHSGDGMPKECWSQHSPRAVGLLSEVDSDRRANVVSELRTQLDPVCNREKTDWIEPA